jgi:glycerol-3-phosphate dehydrogenase
MQVATDVVIFGGGCAGLWLLDALRRRGYRALLLESQSLGAGQTGLAQGILHSGLKYLFHSQNTTATESFQGVTSLWREALLGRAEPNLSAVQLRAQHGYLWRLDTVRSLLGMTLARHGLKTRPVPVPPHERPEILARCPGQVWRLDEQVIDPRSLIQAFAARNVGHIWWTSSQQVPRFRRHANGEVRSVCVVDGHQQREIEITTGCVLLAAGAGNESLRVLAGLPGDVMQRRPLHVAMAIGRLPQLNGHCVDGTGTRVTITSETCDNGRTAWQLGGRISEVGTKLSSAALVELAESELKTVLPGISLSDCQWRTRCIDRAEAKTGRGNMPNGPQMLQDKNVFTLWPTKLVLAPLLPALVEKHIRPSRGGEEAISVQMKELHWPTPPMAAALWKEAAPWRHAA